MRDFNDKDRKKKSQRIQLDENPAGLSAETLARLQTTIKASLKDGHLPCPVGWKIAKEMGIPRIAVGAVMDKLGVRVANCQLGFFRVDKTPHGEAPQDVAPEVIAALRDLDATGKLTCMAAFELARRCKMTPLKVSKTASALGIKIRTCQLGCF